MGLDSYLYRMPRCEGVTARDVCNIENYIDYIEDCKNPDSKAKEYTLEEWIGTKESEVKFDKLEFYQHFYNTKYYDWDKEHNYPHGAIMDQIAYWRKANAIHDWFVNNVQDGEDDCSYHNEVTKELLEELLDVCERVLENPQFAIKLLPTTAGFFFGSTDYDEWYFDGIKYTADKITTILEETDFDKEMVYYISSW